MVLEISSLETHNLISVMNKMLPKEFLRLRKSCKGLNNFVTKHQAQIGVIVDSRIDLYYRGRIELAVDRRMQRLTLEQARQHFSGYSFGHISFHFDPSELNEDEMKELKSFLGGRIWRQAYLSLDSMKQDILEIVHPRWLFTSLPLTSLQGKKYRERFEEITSVPEVERLVFGIKDYRGPEIFELVLEKWRSNQLGNLIYVVPGLNFTFCNVEDLETEPMLETIQRRHMKTIFESLDKFFDKNYRKEAEIYEANHLPEERFQENIEPTYKPLGIIKIHVERDGRQGCLVIEIVQFGTKDFNVSFCFYTTQSSVEEYTQRMITFMST